MGINWNKNVKYPMSLNVIIFDSFFICALIISFAFQTPQAIALSIISAVIYSCTGRIQINRTFILFYSSMVSILMLSAFKPSFGFTPILYLAASPFLFLAAKKFSYRPIGSILNSLRVCYFIFASCIFFQIFNNFSNPSPLESFFKGTSANGISSYLIVFQLAYSLTFFLKLNRLPIFSAFITLIISYFCLGRFSIAMALLIFLFSVLYNYKKKILLTRKSYSFYILPALIALFFFIYYWSDVYYYFVKLFQYTRFSSGFTDSHRALMIHDYLSKINFMTLLFGADFNNTSILTLYGGNPHNSFIRLHSFYGLAGLIFIFIPIFFLVKSSRLKAQKNIALILIAFALLRSTSEPIFFPSTLDFFYFFYFLVFFQHSEKTKEADYV